MEQRIYLSGPMTGIPCFNYRQFFLAARRLREAGWYVVNPAETFEGDTELPREVYMRVDVALLTNCGAIAMLRGWKNSRGARLEYLIARELGMDVYDAETLKPMTAAPGASVMITDLQTASL